MRNELINLLEENNSNKELLNLDIGIYIDKLIEKAIIILHYEKSVAVGFCAFYTNDLEAKKSFLTMICVGKKHQSFGIGGLLFQYWINYVMKLNFKSCELEVRKNNFNALGLYKKFGFKISSETVNHYLMIREF